MSILHVPFYPSDWLAGTRGLSDAETGVYITLIARMYEMAGPIDRDDARLARLCGCKSKRAFAKTLEYLIDEGKITEGGGQLFNDRVQKEIEKVITLSAKTRAAANARWNKKPNKNNAGENAPASPEHMRGRCQPEPELEKRETNVSPKRGTRLPADWTLPEEWAAWAIDRGLPRERVERTALEFANYWQSLSGSKATKLDWFKTWQNRVMAVVDRLPRNPPNGGPNGSPTSAGRKQRAVENLTRRAEADSAATGNETLGVSGVLLAGPGDGHGVRSAACDVVRLPQRPALGSCGMGHQRPAEITGPQEADTRRNSPGGFVPIGAVGRSAFGET